jgi:hypothetical protein
MKKVGIIILSLAILFSMVPQTVSAAEGDTLEVELNAYLGEVIKTDLSNLNSLYGNYKMDETVLSGIYGKTPEKLEENQKPSAPRTIKGGKLPKTATNNIPGVILGGLPEITGILMYYSL